MAQNKLKNKPTHYVVEFNGKEIINESIGDIVDIIVDKNNEIRIVLSMNTICQFVDDNSENNLRIFLR